MAKALLGKAAMADDHPNCAGGVGLLGAAPAQAALEGCDTLLIVGSSFPYIEFYPKPGAARAVQIDHDGAAHRPALSGRDAAWSATPRRPCGRLLPLLERQGGAEVPGAAFRPSIGHWRDTLASRAEPSGQPMRRDVPAHALNKLLPAGAIVTTDCGVNTAYAARHLVLREGMMFSTSGTLASMGAGLPYAIAAKLAWPERPVIAFVGDGGLTMLMGEMATLRKYQLDVKIIVLKNNSLGQIKWEQMAFLGNPEYVCDLEPIDFAKVAEGFGLKGLAVRDPARVDAVLAEAFAHSGPVLVEVEVDPNDPLLPPKIKPRQAMNLAKALLHGTPGREAIISNAVEDLAREIV